MNIDIHVIHAFVDEGVGGNPAGVVLEADDLTSTMKLAIAKAVGLSETAFISKSDAADFKLEFYTPDRQIAHCGHATIAAFSYLRQMGLVTQDWTSKETIDGRREIKLKGMTAYMEQLAPHYENPESASPPLRIQKIAHSLHLRPDALSAAPVICSTGNRFLLVAVPDWEALQGLEPDQAAIHDISERLDLVGYYVFTRGKDGFAATTRMFAPRYGIAEESATGMAAGPLACHLKDHLGVDDDTMHIQQGVAMPHPSPSRLHVELEMGVGGIRRLFVGGVAKVVRSISLKI